MPLKSRALAPIATGALALCLSAAVAVPAAPAKGAKRTQPMAGEAKKMGALWSDPVAAAEQLVHGGNVAESSMHLWRYELPADLAAGTHTAEVTSTDRSGNVSTETIEFTVTD